MELHSRGDMVATQNEDADLPRPAGDHLIDFLRKTGAGEGIRTLDPNLGKIAIAYSALGGSCIFCANSTVYAKPLRCYSPQIPADFPSWW